MAISAYFYQFFSFTVNTADVVVIKENLYDDKIRDEEKYFGHEYLKLHPHKTKDIIEAVLEQTND